MTGSDSILTAFVRRQGGDDQSLSHAIDITSTVPFHGECVCVWLVLTDFRPGCADFRRQVCERLELGDCSAFSMGYQRNSPHAPWAALNCQGDLADAIRWACRNGSEDIIVQVLVRPSVPLGAALGQLVGPTTESLASAATDLLAADSAVGRTQQQPILMASQPLVDAPSSSSVPEQQAASSLTDLAIVGPSPTDVDSSSLLARFVQGQPRVRNPTTYGVNPEQLNRKRRRPHRAASEPTNKFRSIFPQLVLEKRIPAGDSVLDVRCDGFVSDPADLLDDGSIRTKDGVVHTSLNRYALSTVRGFKPTRQSLDAWKYVFCKGVRLDKYRRPDEVRKFPTRTGRRPGRASFQDARTGAADDDGDWVEPGFENGNNASAPLCHKGAALDCILPRLPEVASGDTPADVQFRVDSLLS